MTVGDLLREELHDLQRGVFLLLICFSFVYMLCVYFCLFMFVCLLLFVCLNSITMLEFLIFVKYLFNIEENV